MDGKPNSIDPYAVPLSEYIRPTNLSDYIGQRHLVDPENGQISGFLNLGYLPSMILSGPPGVGKTTIASILAARANYVFLELSATDATVAELKDLLISIRAENKKRAKWSHGNDTKLRVVVFIDEIHRFSKVQQDFLLPFIETGDFVFLGATTVEPQKRIRRAILSRCQLFCLENLNEQDSFQILKRAILYENLRRKKRKHLAFIQYSNDAIYEIAKYSQGDMRSGINCVELLSTTYSKKEHGVAIIGDSGFIDIDLRIVKLTLSSLTKMRLGLKDEKNLSLVNQLLSFIGDENVAKGTKIGYPRKNTTLRPSVLFKRNKVLFFVKFKLPRVFLSLLEMECCMPYPKPDEELNERQSQWVEQMEVSDDSDGDLQAMASHSHVLNDNRTIHDRFRLFSAIHTMANLVERGESVLLILKYLVIYTCLFTSGKNEEICIVRSAISAVKRASVDPLHVLCDCIEYLCFAEKADHSIVKKIEAVRLFLVKIPGAKASDKLVLDCFKVVYDDTLAAKLLQPDEIIQPKNNNIENNFSVEFVDSSELDNLTGYHGLNFNMQ